MLKCMKALYQKLGKYAIVKSHAFNFEMDLHSIKVCLRSDDLHIKDEEIRECLLKWERYKNRNCKIKVKPTVLR